VVNQGKQLELDVNPPHLQHILIHKLAIAVVNAKPVVYSLGNYCLNQTQSEQIAQGAVTEIDFGLGGVTVPH
jgi:poly-gamma-glutamate capsule biosynthesis protein CapA/YwtB (metallophosphatase superfamily)